MWALLTHAWTLLVRQVRLPAIQLPIRYCDQHLADTIRSRGNSIATMRSYPAANAE